MKPNSLWRSNMIPTNRESPGRLAVVSRLTLALGLAVLSSTAVAASSTRVSAFEYQANSGLLTKEIIEPDSTDLCLVTTHTYDAHGNRSSTVQRNCNGSVGSHPGINSEASAPPGGSPAYIATRTSTKTYSDPRYPTMISNALGQSETTSYDATAGQPTSIRGPNGLYTYWKYDVLGRRILEKRADGNGTKWEYLYCSGVNGGTASCPTIQPLSGGSIPAAYLVRATPVSAPIDIDVGTTGAANGAITTVYFDALDRELRTETQGYDGGTTASKQIYKDTEYDAFGRVARVSRPYYAAEASYWSSVEYDLLGRVVAQSALDDNNQTITTSIDYSGLTTTTTNPKGQVASKTTDALGNVLETVDADGKTVSFAYDPFGNLVTSVDSSGNTTTLYYDTRGRKVAMRDPDMGYWTYSYDVLGHLVKQVNSRNEVTLFSYDLLGRMISRSEPSLNSTWKYDRYADNTLCGHGRLCEASAGNGYSLRNTYDSLGRKSSVTETVGKTFTYSWTYDANSRINSVTTPGATFNYTYTAYGYLRNIGNWWRADAMDAEGRVTKFAYYNGVNNTETYNPSTGHLLASTAGTGTSTVVQNIAYTYDSIGNLQSRSDANSGVSATYGYDVLNRLTTETRTGGALSSPQTISWAYDSIGNILSRTDAGVTATYNYPPSGASSMRPHAVSSVTGAVNGVSNPAFTYDAVGNMVSATGRGTIAWASFDKVSSASRTIGSTTKSLDYTYDVNYDRVREVYSLNGVVQRTTYYLHGAGGVDLFFEQEVDGTGTKNKNFLRVGGRTFAVILSGSGSWANSTLPKWQYFHTDHLGSVLAVTDQNGAVAERFAYEPFGKRRNVNGTTDGNGTLVAVTADRGFTDHEMMDEIGLINMNGRIYDPSIGRFLSADPLVQDPLNLQSYNRYAYVLNNPLFYTDPTGYRWGKWWKKFRKKWLKPIITVVVAIYAPELSGAIGWTGAAGVTGGVSAEIGLSGAVASGALGGAAASAITSGGDLKATVIGGLTGAAFGAVGDATMPVSGKATDMTLGNVVTNVAGHAVVGCASAVASGGKCGPGAASAAIGDLGGMVPGNSAAKFVSAVVSGGTASAISGGKFGNGAITAAFGYLFNACQHGQCGSSPEENGLPIGATFEGGGTGIQVGANASGHVATLGLSGEVGAIFPNRLDVCAYGKLCTTMGPGLAFGAGGTIGLPIGEVSSGWQNTVGISVTNIDVLGGTWGAEVDTSGQSASTSHSLRVTPQVGWGKAVVSTACRSYQACFRDTATRSNGP